jgi:hypothetical protein
MQIQVNTDHNIEGREALFVHVRSVVERALSHESGHVTRVEVHVADENGPKSSPSSSLSTRHRCIKRSMARRTSWVAWSNTRSGDCMRKGSAA